MLSRQRIPRLCDLVPGSSNLHNVPPYLHSHVHTEHSRILRPSFLLLPRSSSRKIRLMLATLSMGEV